MRSRKLSVLVLALLCAGASANEGGGEGEGGGAEAAAPPKEQREYNEKSAKLGTVRGRLEDAEKRFAEVVHHKTHATSTEEKQHLIHELVEIADQRNKDVVEFEKLKSELKLRYPNQGEKIERHYGAHEAKSAEELERSLGETQGLDELLTSTKRMIEDRYAPLDHKPAATSRTPASTTESSGARPRLRLEK